jgi:hypothetical protein
MELHDFIKWKRELAEDNLQRRIGVFCDIQSRKRCELAYYNKYFTFNDRLRAQESTELLRAVRVALPIMHVRMFHEFNIFTDICLYNTFLTKAMVYRLRHAQLNTLRIIVTVDTFAQKLAFLQREMFLIFYEYIKDEPVARRRLSDIRTKIAECADMAIECSELYVNKDVAWQMKCKLVCMELRTHMHFAVLLREWCKMWGRCGRVDKASDF